MILELSDYEIEKRIYQQMRNWTYEYHVHVIVNGTEYPSPVNCPVCQKEAAAKKDTVIKEMKRVVPGELFEI